MFKVFKTAEVIRRSYLNQTIDECKAEIEANNKLAASYIERINHLTGCNEEHINVHRKIMWLYNRNDFLARSNRECIKEIAKESLVIEGPSG